jgi:hypothetical protein
MARPMLKWIFLSGLALCMSLCSLQAQTQKNIVTVDHIAAVSGLQAHTPMAMPTSRQGSREALAIAAASPFAGSASLNAALNFGACASRAICKITGGRSSVSPKTIRFL